jgi:hypothetical protein
LIRRGRKDRGRRSAGACRRLGTFR